MHADKIWADDDRPSARDCVLHARSLRSPEELRAYMRRYQVGALALHQNKLMVSAGSALHQKECMVSAGGDACRSFGGGWIAAAC
jgi:hypothetical protein